MSQNFSLSLTWARRSSLAQWLNINTHLEYVFPLPVKSILTIQNKMQGTVVISYWNVLAGEQFWICWYGRIGKLPGDERRKNKETGCRKRRHLSLLSPNYGSSADSSEVLPVDNLSRSFIGFLLVFPSTLCIFFSSNNKAVWKLERKILV